MDSNYCLKRSFDSSEEQIKSKSKFEKIDETIEDIISDIINKIDSNERHKHCFDFLEPINQSIVTTDDNNPIESQLNIGSNDSIVKITTEELMDICVPSVPQKQHFSQNSDQKFESKIVTNEESLESMIGSKCLSNEDTNRLTEIFELNPKVMFVCSETQLFANSQTLKDLEMDLNSEIINQRIEKWKQSVENEFYSQREKDLVPDIDFIGCDDKQQNDPIFGLSEGKSNDKYNEIDSDESEERINDSLFDESIVPQIDNNEIQSNSSSNESSTESSEEEKVPEVEPIVAYPMSLDPIKYRKFKKIPLKVGLNKNRIKRGSLFH